MMKKNLVSLEKGKVGRDRGMVCKRKEERMYVNGVRDKNERRKNLKSGLIRKRGGEKAVIGKPGISLESDI